MKEADRLIICISPTGNFQGKEINPNLPIQPDEISDEVYRCWNEGAAIAHIHARDEKGIPTNDPKVFGEIKRKVREKKCDIILQFSTAPGRQLGVSVDDGFQCLEAEPEMASISMGPTIVEFRGQEMMRAWSRSLIERWVRVMVEKSIKPEHEVYNPGHMEEVKLLIEKNILKKPYWISFVMDMHRVFQTGVRYTPKNLMHYVDILPSDSIFSVIAIGRAELPATTLSILLGGHLRVGFEDNVYYSKGVLADSNAQLVTRAARLGRELGREPASPEEARRLLGMTELRL